MLNWVQFNNNTERYYEIIQNNTWSYNVPKSRLMIKWLSNITSQQKQFVLNQLRSIMAAYKGSTVVDVSTILLGL